MKTTIKLCVILTLSVITLVSCSKYDEGPGFSLKTKKSRLVGEYDLEKLIVAGEEITDFDLMTYKFKKDETLDLTVTVEILGVETSTTTTFGWEFSSDKDRVLLTEDSQVVDEYFILKLTNDEFWFNYTEDGSDLEVHLSKK